MLYYPVDPPPKMLEAIRRQQGCHIDVDELVDEGELSPPERDLWRASRPIFVALAWLDTAIRNLVYVGMVTLGVMAGFMVAVLVLHALLNPVLGAQGPYAVCAELLPEHREVFLKAAEGETPGTKTTQIDAATCRLLVPSATSLAAIPEPGSIAGQDSFMNPATIRSAIERSYPSSQ